MKAGEIWITNTTPLRRHVLILAAEPGEPWVLAVLLAGGWPEFATDSDVTLPRAATGLPYDLLAQTSLVGPVLKERLLEFIGFFEGAEVFLDPEAAERFPVLRGLPVWERSDPRVAFKREEGRFFDPLQREALATWSEL